MDSLFPDSEVRMLSPKLAWMAKHGVISWYDDGKRDGFKVCDPQWFAGFQAWWPDLTGIQFFAEETAHNGDSRIGEGQTEDEALFGLTTCAEARQMGLRIYNEETP